MNTADRSIAFVDLALRRRFYFVEFHPDDEPVRGVLRRWISAKHPRMEWVADVVERANELLKDDRHAAIGPSYFMKKDRSQRSRRSSASGSTAFSPILRNVGLGETKCRTNSISRSSKALSQLNVIQKVK